MVEFTNGVVPAPTNSHSCDKRFAGTVCEASCPYCGWLYDQPECCVPAHARCEHLIATAQWSDQAGILDEATVRDENGRWLAWETRGSDSARRALESALRTVMVKVESSTASIQLACCDGLVLCRYYFSRRERRVYEELRKVVGSNPTIVNPGLRPSKCQLRHHSSNRACTEHV